MIRVPTGGTQIAVLNPLLTQKVSPDMHRRQALFATAGTALAAVSTSAPAQASSRIQATMAAHWVHGNTAQIPSTSGILTVAPTGAGKYVKARATTTFEVHVPLPTPIFYKPERAKITVAFLLYKAERENILLKSIEVFDGYKRIHIVEDINGTGDQQVGFGKANAFVIPPIDVHQGIGLSATFYAKADGELFIASAGADYA